MRYIVYYITLFSFAVYRIRKIAISHIMDTKTLQGRKICLKTKEAVAKRIIQLCEEKHIAINALANMSGVTPSTVYSMMRDDEKDLSVIIIKKLCDGLDMTITDSFDNDNFRNLEQEIL